MSRLSIRGWTLSAALWFFTAIFAPWSAIEAQVASGEPRIQHAALNCIPLTEFVYIQALIDPTNEIRAARVYFRAEQHSIFYYVDMTPSGGLFEALLPRPAESTQAVRYYVEAITSQFTSSRTEEIVAEVASEEATCREKNPEAVYFPGDNPQILLTPHGTGPAIPPGFIAAGIAAAGRGTGLIIGGAAAAAAIGAGAVVVTGGSNDPPPDPQVPPPPTDPTSPTPSPGTSTVPPTTTVGPSAVSACFETTPSPPRVQTGQSIRLDGSCTTPRDDVTYSWLLGDGRTRDTRVITPVYRDAGTFIVRLTVALRANPAITDFIEMEVLVEAPTNNPNPGPGPTPPPVPGMADLQLNSISPNPLNPGAGVPTAYVANFTNAGPDGEPTALVNWTFGGPASPAFNQGMSSAGCTLSSGGNPIVVSCSVGAIGSGGGGSVTVNVTFPSSGFYNGSATIVGGTTDPNLGNNAQGTGTITVP